MAVLLDFHTISRQKNVGCPKAYARFPAKKDGMCYLETLLLRGQSYVAVFSNVLVLTIMV